MKYISIIFLLIIFGCEPKPKNNITDVENDTISSNTPSIPIEKSSTEKEEFNEFLKTFRKDTSYQLRRVIFPFVVKSRDFDDNLTSEEIFHEEWIHLGFDYKEEYSTRPIDAYTQQIKIYPDSAKIEYRGIDNGIYFDYLFFRIDGKWYLESEEDYSN